MDAEISSRQARWPRIVRASPKDLATGSAEQMTLVVEGVVGGGVDRERALR